MRRLIWRNERSLYHNVCAFSGKKIISMFDPETKLIVYDRDIWWSDKWDPFDYGVDYDFSRPFFEQFKELLKRAPLANLGNTNMVNSDYANHSLDCRNCFLIYASMFDENVSYSTGAMHVKDSMDLYKVLKSEQCYEDVLDGSIYRTHFSYDSDECMDSMFLTSCLGLQNCLGCVNLRHKSYHIFNKKYSKEEYLKLKEKIIEHMKKTEEYGEFFPPQIAPVYYNETQGNLYMPMTKEEVLAKGWQWEENMPGTFGKETISSVEIPDKIEDVSESILKEILACAECSKNYNITRNELLFYQKEKIPMPRKCPNCRYKRRFKFRPLRKLWHRSCMCEIAAHGHESKFPNEF